MTLVDEIAALWSTGLRTRRIARRLGVSMGTVAGIVTRQNLHSAARPDRVRGLRPNHPAIIEGRTLFPGHVVDPAEAPRQPHQFFQQSGGTVLMPGYNQRKLGHRVEKGAWRGMRIFSLTLEERATCPRSCANWLICYGNTSHFAKRYRHGHALVMRLALELAELQALHPSGFVVRLHQLGDFYSAGYVRLWRAWLTQFPALHVFGYTAWPPDSQIGAEVHRLANEQWSRFAVRWSAPGFADLRESEIPAAITLRSEAAARSTAAIICPAQTGKTRSCATCGLCWAPAARQRTIGFLAHGR